MLEKPIYKDWFKLEKAKITEAFYKFKMNPPQGPDFWPRSEGYRVLLTLKSDGQYLDPTLMKLHSLVSSYAKAKGIDKWAVSIRISLRGKKVARMMVVPKKLVNSTEECVEFLSMLSMGKAVVSECSIDLLQFMLYWKPLKTSTEDVRRTLEWAYKTGKAGVLVAGEGLEVKIKRYGYNSWFFHFDFNGYLGWEGKAKPKVVTLKDGGIFVTYSDKRPLWYPALNLISLLLMDYKEN